MTTAVDIGAFELATTELLAEVAEADDAHAQRARYDPAAFTSYVLRDEETALPITLQPMHEEWHRLANHYDRLLLWAHAEGGKTQQLSIGRTLWEIGRNPNLRVCTTSNTYGLSSRVCTTVGKYIAESREFQKVFPEVRIDKGMPWTSEQLSVERSVRAKDPSLRSLGVHGNILGARIDLLIIDDVLDYENTLTKHQRDDLYKWYQSTLETRLTQNARVWCIGTAWHRDDLMHRFARSQGWMAVRYPVMDEVTGKLSWPDRWSHQRVESKKQKMESIVEFNRAYMCVVRSDEESVFRQEYIDRCLKRGEGKDPVYALETVPPGISVYTGVDLGVRTKEGSDLTAFVTVAVYPNGDRRLLWIDAGRWTGPEIVVKIEDHHRRYQGIAIVENNAAQEFIVQFTKERSAAPVRSFTTTGQKKNNHQFGLESLATEMSMGKWIIPNKAGKVPRQMQAWIAEMLYYDPAGHPGDRLMASWFAKEGSRLARPKAKLHTLDLLSR